MPLKSWICLAIIAICLVLSVLNKKIYSFKLFKDYINIFRNYRTKKISVFDILCFFVSPFLISVCIVVGFDYFFSAEISNVLLTIFSITFTLLFGVMSLLSVTLDSDDKIKKQISREAFAAVSFSMFSSLVCLVLLIIYIAFLEKIDCSLLFKILTVIISLFTLNTIMLFFMIIKRSYVTSVMKK